MLLQQQRDSLLHLQHARAGELAAQAVAERLRGERDLLSGKQSELVGLYSYQQGRARMLEEKYDECQRERLQLAAECRQLKRRENDRLRQARDWQLQACKQEQEEEQQEEQDRRAELQSRGRRHADGSSNRVQAPAETEVSVYQPSTSSSSSSPRTRTRAERDAPQREVKRAYISLQPALPSVPLQSTYQRPRPPSFYTMRPPAIAPVSWA